MADGEFRFRIAGSNVTYSLNNYGDWPFNNTGVYVAEGSNGETLPGHVFVSDTRDPSQVVIAIGEVLRPSVHADLQDMPTTVPVKIALVERSGLQGGRHWQGDFVEGTVTFDEHGWIMYYTVGDQIIPIDR
jgi:hypothetical protein